jgi:hypothetical protein
MTKDVPALKNQLKGLSARGAFVTLAQRYGMADKTFIWDGQLYTVRTALADLPDYLLDMNCGDFGIVRFFGGPPKKGQWFDGTVLTMLCDAVLFEENTNTMTEAQKLAL